MVTITASRTLGRFGLTTDDLSAANTEYVIDDVTDYINLKAGTSIADMTGAAGTKEVTLSGDQNAVFMLIMSIMLKDVKALTISSSTTLGMMSVSESIGAQPVNVQRLVKDAIRDLKGGNFKRTF